MTEYLIPRSVEEALSLLDQSSGQALIIAGGTDVLPDLRQGRRTPEVLVDITRIPGLKGVQVGESHVEVGAATTFAEIKDHPFLKQQVPALAEAARSVGALAIQTAATWAGNLVQAMPAADGAVVALALEAEVQVVDAEGAAWRPVESLFLGPGESVIDPTRQIVTCIRFPIPAGRWGTAWRRIGRRPSLVLPILNCAVKVELRGDRVERAAVALGPVAPRPFRAAGTEAFLVGKPITPGLFEEAGEIAQGESNPRSSVMRASREYRLAVIPILVSEALATACRRAGASALEAGDFPRRS
jgi:CO/xanthine dehydrogenase FAD-binding subunit